MSRLKKHVRNYTQVGNDIINAKNLTLKAKGLFLFLLSKPDNWNFSARLIAFQNKDAIASVNTGLQELEDFGLLNRLPCQGGYDYEIFDTVQSYLVENRLSGKSTKRQSKIHLVENRPSISNKELKAMEDEREKEVDAFNPFLISSKDLISPHISSDTLVQTIATDWKDSDLFFDFVSKNAKNPFIYRCFVRDALFCTAHKKHEKTVDAYFDFMRIRPDLFNGALPIGVSIFDLIGRA